MTMAVTPWWISRRPSVISIVAWAWCVGTSDSIVREWGRRGWLDADRGRLTKQVPRPIPGEVSLERRRRMRMVVLLADRVGVEG